MATREIYERNQDGTLVLVSTENIPDENNYTDGEVVLGAGGIATVQTTNAGKPVVLTRISTGGTLGQLYINSVAKVDGVSFQIKSNNTADRSTVYWVIVQD
jgi:hypothetical protein